MSLKTEYWRECLEVRERQSNKNMEELHNEELCNWYCASDISNMKSKRVIQDMGHKHTLGR
jgi:hypothetical protein